MKVSDDAKRSGTATKLTGATATLSSVQSGKSEVAYRLVTPSHAPGKNIQAFDVLVGGAPYSVALDVTNGSVS
jgi:hypothetical protein